MYQELELADEIDIVRIDSNDSEYDSDICSTFKGGEANKLVEMGRIVVFCRVS